MKPVKNIYEIYEEVLSGKRIQFPLHTWNHKSESKRTLIKLIRYVVFDKLQWDRKQFCDNFCLDIIIKFKLNTGFMKVYNRNIHPLISDCFPEWEIKVWELRNSRVPRGYWTKENAVKATKWLIEDRLKWDLEKVSREISFSYFLNNNLSGMLRILNISVAEAIINAYPNYNWDYLKERKGYKITLKQSQEIRELYKKGYSQRAISRMYNCNPTTIFYIVHNKAFKE